MQPGQRGILPLHCGQPCQRKTENQNCDAALVTNTAVPEPYAAQLSQAGIRVIACPFDNYRFEAI